MLLHLIMWGGKSFALGLAELAKPMKLRLDIN